MEGLQTAPRRRGLGQTGERSRDRSGQEEKAREESKGESRCLQPWGRGINPHPKEAEPREPTPHATAFS